jgi:hypothetical protein
MSQAFTRDYEWARSFETEFQQLDDGLEAYIANARPGHPGIGGPSTPTGEPLTRPDGSDPDGFYLKVANRYPRRIAEAYDGDITRALADDDETVAATVADWERRHGLVVRD